MGGRVDKVCAINSCVGISKVAHLALFQIAIEMFSIND